MKKVLVIVLALCLVMGAAVAEATAHLDKLTLEFVPSKDADVIIAGTEGLPEMLQAALLEQGYEVDEIDITVGTSYEATGEALAAGSIVLLLVYPGLISLLGVASFAVWAVVTVGTLLQVYGVKLNLVTILLCVAFCIAGYYAVSGLRDWFLHACYSYDINDVLSGLGDLFG